MMDKTSKDNKLKIIGLAALGLILLVGGIVSECSQNSREAAKAAKAAAEAEARELEELRLAGKFDANRKAIIDEVLTEIDEGNFWRARAIARKYEHVADPYLISLDSQAHEKQLLKEIGRVPESDAARRHKIYAQLVELVPASSEYQRQKQRYGEIVGRQRAATKARLDKYGAKPGENDIYSAVRRYLRQVAHDPRSIQDLGCTYPRFTEMGWMVACQYRGRNGFGGMVKNRNFFYLRHGSVVSMSEVR